VSVHEVRDTRGRQRHAPDPLALMEFYSSYGINEFIICLGYKGYIVCSLLRQREALCTHGRQVRGFLHVADVGAAFAAILDSELQGAVNVGSGERISPS
jgi:nucleoside-diphosphate-sugar epimerase